MARRPRLIDIAKAAGVHPSTASRALDPKLEGRLSKEVVRRVRRAAQELGYSRNALAASLRTQSSRTVGVIVPDLANTMFPAMFQGIERRLSLAGYCALLATSDFRAEKARQAIDTFLDRRIDGLVIASADLTEAADLAALGAKVPTVLLNREIADSGLSAVVADDERGIAMAFAHLVELGHRRIVHLAGPQNTSTGVTRRAAFLAAADRHGIAADPAAMPTANAFTEGEGYRLTRALLADGPPPEALLAANDWLAIGARQALFEAGISCPQDVSLTGYNDMPFADRIAPPLTTVRIPHDHMGAEAADQLLALIADPARPSRRAVMAPTLIVRSSTAPRAAAGA
ncbi:LacI family transcriptional regulator [Acuticoccus sediminis]|uniref:LacI family transcriptional regulator n=1 Tax=Acuticoccus sediminis TaxID=2184697 RepID=A0A8B2P049_9HYPH|nr:LacI family DNA-binding transcriptional regulator [Acuticoccus sediminis]RAI02180.1 LacI family transcriptional regulator [Acuticoccus sediminis]